VALTVSGTVGLILYVGSLVCGVAAGIIGVGVGSLLQPPKWGTIP
jgi:hypothetical protein